MGWFAADTNTAQGEVLLYDVDKLCSPGSDDTPLHALRTNSRCVKSFRTPTIVPRLGDILAYTLSDKAAPQKHISPTAQRSTLVSRQFTMMTADLKYPFRLSARLNQVIHVVVLPKRYD
ncbi:hypothetical protein ARMGADRAFT_1113525 [Armillaria gallica]|uniref:Uncharacterized protein n=1 Tax=Armillaria gallica TaxID=47427 RepID=A0A2H3D747_ARMGA|nr:hypothetical protein ARMGADRAFT_1113525 [Armillaria gallica]